MARRITVPSGEDIFGRPPDRPEANGAAGSPSQGDRPAARRPARPRPATRAQGSPPEPAAVAEKPPRTPSPAARPQPASPGRSGTRRAAPIRAATATSPPTRRAAAPAGPSSSRTPAGTTGARRKPATPAVKRTAATPRAERKAAPATRTPARRRDGARRHRDVVVRLDRLRSRLADMPVDTLLGLRDRVEALLTGDVDDAAVARLLDELGA